MTLSRRAVALVRFGFAAVLSVAIAIFAAGCGPVEPNTLVTGWSVGAKKLCADDLCREERRVAEAALEERYPGHLAVTGLTIHEEGLYPQPDGTPAVGHWAGGCCDVALVRFADESMVAFGVGSDLIGGPVIQAYFKPPSVFLPE